MQNATNFADAKNPNRYANHMKKLKKEIKSPMQKAHDAINQRLNLSPVVTIPDRRTGDRRKKLKTRMHFGTEAHTQWFDADKDKPKYEGRYKVKYAGAPRFVFRYWNPETKQWQYNRRKAAIECTQPGVGDTWCGLAAKSGI